MAKKSDRPNNLNNLKLLDSDQEDLQISSICKFIRLVFKATQKEMAEKLSVSLSTYRDWEYGRYVPKSWQAINLGLLYVYAKEQISHQSFNQHENASNQEAA